MRRLTRDPETKPASCLPPENGWLEDEAVSYWDGPFSGAMLVLGRVHFRSYEAWKPACYRTFVQC